MSCLRCKHNDPIGPYVWCTWNVLHPEDNCGMYYPNIDSWDTKMSKFEEKENADDSSIS
jgi:hypothetical protein